MAELKANDILMSFSDNGKGVEEHLVYSIECIIAHLDENKHHYAQAMGKTSWQGEFKATITAGEIPVLEFSSKNHILKVEK